MGILNFRAFTPSICRALAPNPFCFVALRFPPSFKLHFIFLDVPPKMRLFNGTFLLKHGLWKTQNKNIFQPSALGYTVNIDFYQNFAYQCYTYYLDNYLGSECKRFENIRKINLQQSESMAVA